MVGKFSPAARILAVTILASLSVAACGQSPNSPPATPEEQETAVQEVVKSDTALVHMRTPQELRLMMKEDGPLNAGPRPIGKTEASFLAHKWMNGCKAEFEERMKTLGGKPPKSYIDSLPERERDAAQLVCLTSALERSWGYGKTIPMSNEP